MSHTFFWPGACGAVAKLAAERVSTSEPAIAGLAAFGFSGAGADTRSRKRARSEFAARRAPTAVMSSAPGLKWMVTMRPITRPAMSSAQAPGSVKGPLRAVSMPLPTQPPACAAMPNSPTSASTATAPEIRSTARGRGALGQSSQALRATAAATVTNHDAPKAESMASRMPPRIEPA